jgi:hypothetical protein
MTVDPVKFNGNAIDTDGLANHFHLSESNPVAKNLHYLSICIQQLENYLVKVGIFSRPQLGT